MIWELIERYVTWCMSHETMGSVIFISTAVAVTIAWVFLLGWCISLAGDVLHWMLL